MPVRQLPEIVGRAVFLNVSAVADLRVLREQHELLSAEHAELVRAHVALQAVQHTAQSRGDMLESNLESNETQLHDLHAEYQQQLDSAAELAERQNSLVMALETKVSKYARTAAVSGKQVNQSVSE